MVDLNSYYLAIQITGIIGLVGCLFIIITFVIFKDFRKLRFYKLSCIIKLHYNNCLLDMLS